MKNVFEHGGPLKQNQEKFQQNNIVKALAKIKTNIGIMTKFKLQKVNVNRCARVNATRSSRTSIKVLNRKAKNSVLLSTNVKYNSSIPA